MKLSAFATLFAAVGAANASGLNHHHGVLKRQASTTDSSSASSSAASSSSGGASSTASSGSSASVTAPASTGTASSNVEGVPPLKEITFGMPSGTAWEASTTVASGVVPTISGIPDAPAIPGFVFKSGAWPKQDKAPPTDSEEVKAWMKELDGFDIPDLEPTTDGYCASDPEFAADAENRGWWTCGGWTRDTDIVACNDKLTWGVSFDDGPGPYTPKLLKYLDEKDISATFFVVGSRVIERPAILVQEYMSGHEIAVHTWSHTHLTQQTTEQIVAELGWTRKAIKEVLGVTPTTMRPPYGDIDDRVRAISLAMGLVPMIWTRTPSATFDTNDWAVAAGNVDGESCVETFNNILGNATELDTGMIVLAHDLYEITVDLNMGYNLEAAQKHDPPFTLKAIGQCMDIPATDMYRETNTNKTFPSNKVAIDVSGDGTSDAETVASAGNGAAAMTLSTSFATLAGLAAVFATFF
ncbi:carbohydrate esterase family 4 protein [Cylindrobasidium torrendii FP15055 ss-10]|uniref:chitin deacetylase n=1 Tax=Cylindrobasidium torrendii FP15055 ss-10 TaxID=1314674 RepID=A0A0D7BN78_9AGAR|nr:carbohydrate esterase family 4 protein [Cylindrobasidium torrendii FP15055 ss-10]